MGRLFRFTIILLCFAPAFLPAQSGDFYVTQHVPENLEVDNISFDIISDQNGLLAIANRSGVLLYDGSYWDFFPTPSAALSLAVDDNNTIYVGCVGQFGKIDYVDKTFEYVPLFTDDTARELFVQTIANENKIYFFGGENIHAYDTDKQLVTEHAGDFLNIYAFRENVYANGFDSTFLVDNGALKYVDAGHEIAYTFKGENEVFSSDLDGLLYKMTEDGWEALPHNPKLEEMGVYISGAVALNDTLITCSTLTDGCLFLNVKDTSYLEVIDYHTGLPDNEVFAIHNDAENGVWVAHEFGLTRIAPLFPAHSYSHYPGLEGNLFSATWVDGTLWVSSSLGVYYFDRDTSFTEKVYYTTEQTKTTSRRPVVQKKEEVEEEPEQEEVEEEVVQEETGKKKKNKGFLKNLFRKKERALEENPSEKLKKTHHAKRRHAKKIANSEKEAIDKAEEEVSDEDRVHKIQGQPETHVRYIRNTRKIPTAISYRFTKVPNASGKFKELVRYRDKLLGASTSGVFEIEEESSHLVIHEPVRTIHYLEKADQLLVDTYNRELKLYTLQDDHIWVELDEMELDDIILSIYEDKDGGLWLIGTSTIYQASLTGTWINIDTTYEVNNKIFDVMNVIARNDTLTFINYEGYFYLDEERGEVVENEALKERLGLPHNHFQDQQGNVWIFNGKIWLRLTKDGNIQPYDYLSIFKDLRFVSFDEESGRYWLITDDNELLNYDVHIDAGVGDAYGMFLKRVSSQARAIDHKELFTVNYDESHLSFELSRPEYAGFLNLEYQYLLEGLQENWSAWNASNIIDFSYLPPGSYRLKVRTRDAFGRTDEDEVIAFKVSAPYWQQSWFYALQVLLFGSLMMISFRLNQKSAKNQLLSEGLTILTIILVIEFLQSVIGSSVNVKSSPIADFLVDASVALLIFPLERFLRIYLRGGKISLRKMKVIHKEAEPVKS